ncbi:hypothetical protein GGR52DRAFT_592408 [Hypoxylon sp. FL1284]|nr:hypothetical protein GGR52DRAFT_592408 [Hypoxylon sp. FL1284]
METNASNTISHPMSLPVSQASATPYSPASVQDRSQSQLVAQRPEEGAGKHVGKPHPHGAPPAWSEKRAGLNDALDYFKAHQGSVYTRDKKPFGVLIDSEVDVRDHFSSQVIITSIGGGRVKDTQTGKMVRTEDQDEKSRGYQSLNGAKGQVVVMIAGAGNRLFPVKPPHHYCVLDHFVITDVWAEMTTGGQEKAVKSFKVRLQKLDLGTRSWFAPKDASPLEAGEFEVGQYTCKLIDCPSCKTSSKEKFTKGWTCLNRKCDQFFAFGGEHDVDVDSLEYNENFLRERVAYKAADNELLPLVPSVPADDDKSLGCEKSFKQGIVCPNCGCCSRRIKWEGWECENPECDYVLQIPIKAIPLEMTASENQKAKSREMCHETIKVERSTVGRYEITTYLLPSEALTGEDLTSTNLPDKDGQHFVGSVTRIRPNEGIRTRPGGLNDLYMDMQGQNISLERRGARNAGQRIEELTSHFTANFGAPYKFGVVVKDSIGFHSAPRPVMETLLRLTWAGQTAVEHTHALLKKEDMSNVDGAIPNEFQPFNEQLVLGYFENSKISAHDDGERELGPTVATVSLGSPSIMKFHPKRGKELGDGDKNRRQRPAMLALRLLHGDYLVMHGAQIQKLYNHSVVPEGLHRFALTCRYIIKETIPDEKQRELSEIDGRIPEQWAAIKYDGAEDTFITRETGEATALLY